MRRNDIWPLILLVLIVIGIVSNPGPLIIPLILIGIVAFLYFFPPNRWRYLLTRWKMSSRPTSSTHRNKQAERKSRKAKFRVIQGNKSDDSDEPPTYH